MAERRTGRLYMYSLDCKNVQVEAETVDQDPVEIAENPGGGEGAGSTEGEDLVPPSEGDDKGRGLEVPVQTPNPKLNPVSPSPLDLHFSDQDFKGTLHFRNNLGSKDSLDPSE